MSLCASVAEDAKMAPDGPSHCSHPCRLLPLGVGGDRWFASDPQIVAKGMGYCFCDYIMNDCVFHFPCTLYWLSCWLWWRKCFMRRPMWQEIAGWLWPVSVGNWGYHLGACKELNPNNPMSSEGVIFPVKPQMRSEHQAGLLMAVLWDMLKQKTQLSCGQTPDPQKLWDNEYVLFELLNWW